ncbi:hypothetical protein BGZ61DRAFT_441714 [Ilyonectria robusta]|uniref:uncharacterized protein n=1 Tax=Ilyonectria robusta TaxID=1079257 RepID=UPI001E8CE7CD|nr:uncharacterized protein BGZ61DRAFT_441714 [Ilyonectria robusta]KAH8736242.1 hypothetical protein BGZ61DRAFT_441714 [Ilyonectria robusta]
MSSQEPKEPMASKAPEPASVATAAAKSEDNSAPWNEDKRRKFETKSKSEFFDPCQEAAQRSYKCLFRNGGDKAMCGEYFQAYRDCKQAWTDERKKKSGSWF